jgi:hypothetical protein
MRTGTRILICLVFWIAPLTGLTAATQVAYLTPQELGLQSDAVIRGKVLSVESFWNSSHTKVFTRARIAVDETYKGNPRSTVDLIQLGGVVGNVKVTVHGSPRWETGEEVLLFAEPRKAGDFQVTGFSQGKLKILRDPKTGQAYVRAQVEGGAELLAAPPGQQTATASGAEMVPVDEFVEHALGRR